MGRVALRVYLIDSETKTVLASEAFSAQVLAQPRNAQGATTALNQASKRVVDELAIWLERTLSSYPKK